MATLSQVYTNLGMGALVSTLSFIGFDLAVRFDRNKDLVPRAWSRPIQVVKNCLFPPYGLSWIYWAISQRYIDLLAGIPGTGTRMNGWSGPTLRTNLDGIVLLRYHTLQFKVSVLATLLCMVVLLPLYYTVQCDPFHQGRSFCENFVKNTDFEQLTIANVLPSQSVQLVLENGTTISDPVYFATDLDENTTKSLNDLNLLKQDMDWQWIQGTTGRYVATTITIALITIYTCYLLWQEWIECLALRRVYYLESECFQERLEELDDVCRNSDPEDLFQKIRPPYLPHPEMRETIPNVSLHSVLYKLPDNLDIHFVESSDTSLLERQLEAAVEFFDQCIPSRPG